MKSIKNEIIDIDSEVEIVEEFLNAPTTFLEIEKNRDLIRLEMNIVEYPIFSKSKMIKNNQYEKTNKTRYRSWFRNYGKRNCSALCQHRR